jgi:putative hemolysin
VFDALGHKPRPGDAVEAGGASLRVQSLDGLRITRLRIALGGQDKTP